MVSSLRLVILATMADRPYDFIHEQRSKSRSPAKEVKSQDSTRQRHSIIALAWTDEHSSKERARAFDERWHHS